MCPIPSAAARNCLLAQLTAHPSTASKHQHHHHHDHDQYTSLDLYVCTHTTPPNRSRGSLGVTKKLYVTARIPSRAVAHGGRQPAEAAGTGPKEKKKLTSTTRAAREVGPAAAGNKVSLFLCIHREMRGVWFVNLQGPAAREMSSPQEPPSTHSAVCRSGRCFFFFSFANASPWEDAVF
jgi:hypothetical protein